MTVNIIFCFEASPHRFWTRIFEKCVHNIHVWFCKICQHISSFNFLSNSKVSDRMFLVFLLFILFCSQISNDYGVITRISVKTTRNFYFILVMITSFIHTPAWFLFLFLAGFIVIYIIYAKIFRKKYVPISILVEIISNNNPVFLLITSSSISLINRKNR